MSETLMKSLAGAMFLGITAFSCWFLVIDRSAQAQYELVDGQTGQIIRTDEFTSQEAIERNASLVGSQRQWVMFYDGAPAEVAAVELPREHRSRHV